MFKKTTRLLMCAGLLLASGAVAAKADSIVYATTGGQMRLTLEKEFYGPFKEESGTDVVPFDIEVPDQWARVEAMKRTNKYEFDIVTATGPDLVDKADLLLAIDCSQLPNVESKGVEGSCKEKGVARTTGGMLLAYDTSVYKDKVPQTWADFWDVNTFPGPRGLPDTGDRDWWLPAIALIADGVPRDKIFPMDLDRAYKKLDEIKPHINVWWKTGNQVAQIMRDQEVAMTMSYSGRALSAMNDGAPFNVSWNDAVMDTGYFAILKDAPNPEGALKFINYFYGHAEGHPAFIKMANYATHSKEGVALLPEDEQKNYATSPDNYKLLLVPDFKWIGENRNMLRERWQNWLAE